MKPRIFISSTFYDLKYIREDISNFVRAHDFEPIMFEDGDIGYTPGKPLDESCYESMRNYGSPASGEKADDFNEYLSVTRREFSTAANEGIPIYSFVESAVYNEYGVYDSNVKKIEEKQIDLTFKATKNINVFRFIKEIYSLGKISVTEFRKSSEIKEFLSKQWSDMFKNYLKLLKEKSDTKQIYETMDNLQSIIRRMDVMLDGLGKKIMGNGMENVTYDELINQQMKMRAEEFTKKICENFEFRMISNMEKDEAVERGFSLIEKTLRSIKENREKIDLDDKFEIIDIVDKILTSDEKLLLWSANIDFFVNWDKSIEICGDSELKSKILEILKDDKYFNRLFANASFLNNKEDKEY